VCLFRHRKAYKERSRHAGVPGRRRRAGVALPRTRRASFRDSGQIAPAKNPSVPATAQPTMQLQVRVRVQGGRGGPTGTAVLRRLHRAPPSPRAQKSESSDGRWGERQAGTCHPAHVGWPAPCLLPQCSPWFPPGPILCFPRVRSRSPWAHSGETLEHRYHIQHRVGSDQARKRNHS